MKVFEVQDSKFLPHCGCDLRFTVAPGSALVLVGENGIGKTSLLRRLAVQLEQSSRVIIEQNPSEYFFDRKLKKLKAFFLKGQLPLFDEGAFLFLWQAFGLEGKEDRLISQLSGGEAQALKLTLALCKDTTIYLLDEPSQFLDQARKEILKSYLQQLVGREKVLVVVEHNRDWLPAGWKVQHLMIINEQLIQGEEWTIS